MFTYITNAFAHGGIWMYAIMAVQIGSLAIISERAYFLFIKRTGGQKKLTAHLEDDIKKGRLESAISKAQQLSVSEPIGPVAQAGIQAAMNMGGKEEIHAKMEEMIAVEVAQLDQRTSFLSMIGNVATLIGLLGTISGMIKSFSAVSLANAVEKATILSTGISEAMNCTAYGLITAIPALVAFAILTNRSNALQEDLNQACTKVLNWLCFNFEPVQKTAPRKKSV